MARYSIEQRIIKYVKGYAFLKFTRNLSNKRRKQYLDTATIAELDTLKQMKQINY